MVSSSRRRSSSAISLAFSTFTPSTRCGLALPVRRLPYSAFILSRVCFISCSAAPIRFLTPVSMSMLVDQRPDFAAGDGLGDIARDGQVEHEHRDVVVHAQ